jgi:glycosyltransferase involved in cell wall biosynthesis
MEDSIFILGYKSDSEITSYFLNSDIFIMPGTGGLAINEAMAYGLPVISTIADGTITDLLYEGRNGYFLPENATKENIYDVCKKTLQLNRSDLQEMGNLSRQIVIEKATLHNMVDNFEKAILYAERLPG